MALSYVAKSLDSFWDFVESDYSKLISGGHVHCLFNHKYLYPADVWFISNKTKLEKITFTKSTGGFVREAKNELIWCNDIKSTNA